MKKKFTAVILLVFVLFTIAFAATACNDYNKTATFTEEFLYDTTYVNIQYNLKVKSGTVYEVQFTVYYLDGTQRKTETFSKSGEWTAEESPYTINEMVSIDGKAAVTKVIAKVSATSTSNIVYAIVPGALALGALVWLVVALVLTLAPKRKKSEKIASPDGAAEQPRAEIETDATAETDTTDAAETDTTDAAETDTTDAAETAEAGETSKPQANASENTLQKIAKIFMLISCIATGVALIPLIWTIPMTKKYWNNVKLGRPTSTAFKVCTLLFVSTISGILMLCDNK